MVRELITLGLADLIPAWLTLPRSPKQAKSSSCGDAKRFKLTKKLLLCQLRSSQVGTYHTCLLAQVVLRVER